MVQPGIRLASIALASLLVSTLPSPARADHLPVAMGLESSSAVTVESPIPLAPGEWSLALRADYVDFDAFTDRELIQFRGEDPGGDIHSISTLGRASLQLAYGLTGDLTLGARLPYVQRTGVREPETGHCHGTRCVAHDIVVHGDIAGIGDLGVFGTYRLPTRGAGRHLALLFGVEAPTGETDETGFESEHGSGISVPVPPEGGDHEHSHEGGRVETHLQPGSGSWDASLGLAYQQPLGERFTAHSSFAYALLTEGAQETEIGDMVTLQLGVSAPLAVRPFGMAPTLALEALGEWQAREERAGVEVGNSGGRTLYVAPGVRLARDVWSAALSLALPVWVDLNGTQVEPEYRVLATFGRSFGGL